MSPKPKVSEAPANSTEPAGGFLASAPERNGAPQRFSDQRIVVSGGGTGIGRAIALAFARQGGNVMIVGKDSEPLAEVASQQPDLIKSVCCDIRNTGLWRDAIATHRPHVLINNAAVCAKTELLAHDDVSWAELFPVNFEATLHGCREAARHMKALGGGKIVNISSVHARFCEVGSAAYAVAKAAVEQVTRCLANELARDLILVNAVAPGFVDTPMSRAFGVNELETEWFRTHFIASGRIPLRRPAQPEEIAHLVLFLGSRENTYMTGQVVTIDGGLTLTL